MIQSKLSKLKQHAKDSPTTPGVYLMKNDQNKVIYIGKAKKLTNRLQSYFTGVKSKPLRIQRLVNEIDHFDTIIVNTDPQALLLERSLIKTHKPRYNILLRDDKNYPYIKVDIKSKWPRFTMVRKKNLDGGYYLGPFSCSKSLYLVMQLVHELFPLVRCSLYEFSHRTRPCNYYGMKKCLAPCFYQISQKDYKKIVDQAIEFIQIDQSDKHKIIEQRMLEASKQHNYQQAIIYRDQLLALGDIRTQHNSTHQSIANADIINWIIELSTICFNVTHVDNHLIIGSENFVIEDLFIEDISVVCIHFILQYYENRYVPPVIIMPIKIDQVEDLIKALSFQDDVGYRAMKEDKFNHSNEFGSYLKKITNNSKNNHSDTTRITKNHKIKIRSAKNRDEKNLVDACKKNAWFFLHNHLKEHYTGETYIKAVENELSIKVSLSLVECIDISHFSSSAIVASKVSFKQGVPNKSGYRKYNISNYDNKKYIKLFNNQDDFIVNQDDYKAICHVLKKRLDKIVHQDDPEIPDMIVIDGGKGQLNCALKIKQAYFPKLDIKIFSLAKPNRSDKYRDNIGGYNKERLFYSLDKPFIALEPNTLSYRFFTQLRNEAHRFAVTHHRAKFKKARHSSVLENIPGVGAKTRIKLLHNFGSLQKIKSASIEDLVTVSGVSLDLAKIIKNYLQ